MEVRHEGGLRETTCGFRLPVDDLASESFKCQY
jgi:hypothetical protein